MAVSSPFIYYVNASAYDLRKVSSVVPGNDPSTVSVRFIDNPAAGLIMAAAPLEAAWQAALDASQGGGVPFVGATAISNGVQGLVPAPLIADRLKFLCGDGTWANLPVGSVAWGAITGSLAAQTDLQAALNGKADAFTSQAANLIFASPNGSAGLPSFRSLVEADLPTISNAKLANSTITIAGTSTALGGSITLDTITGLSTTGLIKRTAANTLVIATPDIDYLTANQTITLSGEVTGSGATSITTTIAAGAVTLAKMANLAANSLVGNNTGSAATPLALTGTQVTAMLDVFTPTLKGLSPASGGGTVNFLRADGTWTTPPTGPSNVQVFTSSGTWTKPAGATYVRVTIIAPGGGGGSGRRGTAGTVRFGGAGGGGGGFVVRNLLASILGATESVVVGAAGTGGAAVTTNNSDGNPGTNGGDASFGTTILVRATGGRAGLGGTATTSTAGTGGSVYGVAGGAGSNGGTAGVNGVAGTYGGSGGGGGGGKTAGNAPSAGGSSTTPTTIAQSIAAGGAANGSNGGAGVTPGNNLPGSGGGGGGSSAAAAGGAGGVGGTGGGGGGGAASTNGANSGAGGNGGPGYVLVETWT